MLGKLGLICVLSLIAQVPTCGGGGGGGARDDQPPPQQNQNSNPDPDGGDDQTPPPNNEEPPANDPPPPPEEEPPPEPVEQESVYYLNDDHESGEMGDVVDWWAEQSVSLDPLEPSGLSKVDPFLNVGHTDDDRFGRLGYQSALLQWDLWGLPRDIVSVSLELYCFETSYERNTSIYIQRPLTKWAGGMSSPQQVENLVESSLPPPQSLQWYRIDITHLYQMWVSGEWPNFGIRLVPLPEAKNQWVRFTAFGEDWKGKEVFGPEYYPHLVVKYLTISPTLHWPVRPSTIYYHGNDEDFDGNPPTTGYRYGDHWEDKQGEDQYCLNGTTPLLHTGVDFGDGSYKTRAFTPVYTVQHGFVRYARRDDKWGGYIIVEHLDGVSVYEHVYPVYIVNAGDEVGRGQIIGEIADSENNPYNPFGNHLHFQWRATPYDPNHIDRFLRGRLPAESCLTEFSPNQPEPAFPDHFVDPLSFEWHRW